MSIVMNVDSTAMSSKELTTIRLIESALHLAGIEYSVSVSAGQITVTIFRTIQVRADTDTESLH